MSKTVTLADICKKIKMDTKAARAILRRSDDTPEPVGEGTRWEFNAPDALKVEKILKA